MSDPPVLELGMPFPLPGNFPMSIYTFVLLCVVCLCATAVLYNIFLFDRTRVLLVMSRLARERHPLFPEALEITGENTGDKIQ